MKKLVTFILLFITVNCYSQPFFGEHIIDIKQYNILDSLPLERMMIHFNKEIDNKDFITLGDGDYLAPLPHKDKMLIKLNEDKTKGIVVYNSYCFGRHYEFDIQDNERRLILYYKDKNIYCGYIYDKEFKVCKYFESRKEFNHFIRHNFFRRRHNYYDNK